jgi:soluble lytic murein transglycosylase-like protein
MIFRKKKSNLLGRSKAKPHMLFYIKGLMCALLSNSAMAAHAANINNPDDAMLCIQASRNFEREYGIPKNLLYAISVTESGKWHNNLKQVLPWPWTVSVAGKPYYFNNAKQTSSFIRQMMQKGERNIDVGCNQINVRYHGNKFNSIEQMVDPRANTAYAASFLKSLFTANNNWNDAVARYHSATAHLGNKYLAKVHTALKNTRKQQKTKGVAILPAHTNTNSSRNNISPPLVDKRRRSNMMVYYSGARNIKQFSNSNKVASISQKTLARSAAR